ncbi:MAG: UDP-N-acetylglucosamine 2-epimerase [Firmicutes bacterium]|nr:UDP-N-acetylglucosamine 2-epimerase [Bacillota bacterium]
MEEIKIREVVVVGAVRTAVGSFGGSLKDVSAVDLGALVIKEALRRADVDGSQVDEENLGAPLEAICRGLRRVAAENPDVLMVFPVHRNPAVREPVNRHLAGLERVLLIEPLDVADFHNLMQKSTLIFTDSGGVQEEAPSLGVPVLVLRDVTERPEAVAAGTVALVGSAADRLVETAANLLRDQAAYAKMANAINPYGDGRAAERIVAATNWYFAKSGARPEDYSVN